MLKKVALSALLGGSVLFGASSNAAADHCGPRGFGGYPAYRVPYGGYYQSGYYSAYRPVVPVYPRYVPGYYGSGYSSYYGSGVGFGNTWGSYGAGGFPRGGAYGMGGFGPGFSLYLGR
jgi:hypothetical protein